ncbi:hypothetical protein PPL_01292 [Heterostelium album PN500]|uniref:Uncharacterized protein n=1 Tax=Heterostelium pallidum (strain ATCC 26659 / Pp 5 / PN500) TaxID=670386 RepID=D3AYM9_HETP5|nr:hypothetical protein PPL_01292 [Heterostelium album PN500]EFA86056.1 hypothetical protein PPL_01292 [Heterostelium album PN500]|eukprot:XP_020438162.1 hypothetical protein PPL_01292 [Heterostelium album PN500]
MNDYYFCVVIDLLLLSSILSSVSVNVRTKRTLNLVPLEIPTQQI